MQAGFRIRGSGFAERIPKPQSSSANPESQIPNPACREVRGQPEEIAEYVALVMKYRTTDVFTEKKLDT
jgi:hypothetical protein